MDPPMPAKPKFTPKVPPKKEKVTDPVASATPSTVSATTGRANPGRSGDGGRGRGRNTRAHMPMPMGRVFFSGLATPASASSVTSRGLSQNTQTKSHTSSGVSGWQSGGGEAVVKMETRGSGPPRDPSATHAYNSDSEDEGGGTELERDEEWPPLEFDSTAPLSLPYGPKSVEQQERLVNTPLFADALDAEAMLAESEKIFLVQLPSSIDVQASKKHVSTPAESSSSHKEGNTFAPGKIGKIQIMRSGKILMTMSNGKAYQIHAGLPTTFLQYAVAMPEAKVASAEGDAKVKGEGDAKVKGEGERGLCLLGVVSQKIVVADMFN